MIRKIAVFFICNAMLRQEIEAETKQEIEAACEHLAERIGGVFAYFETLDGEVDP